MPYNTILEILSESTARFYKGRHENFCNTFKSQYFLFSLIPICFSEILIFPTLKNHVKCSTHAQFMRAFSAKFLGRKRYWKASFEGTGGLLASEDSMAPSNDKLCIEPGLSVPLKVLYAEMDMEVPGLRTRVLCTYTETTELSYFTHILHSYFPHLFPPSLSHTPHPYKL